MNPFIYKLKLGADLTPKDVELLTSLASRSRRVNGREDLVSDGDRAGVVHLVLEGFACRYKLLPNGRRQITACIVPGDFCDLQMAILGEMDGSAATLTRSTIVELSQATIAGLIRQSPRIERALWWTILVDQAMLRQWVVNLGRRSAQQRTAHLLCELYLRQQAVRRTTPHTFPLPLTQADLGDCLGLSSVQVNRSFQALCRLGVLEHDRRTVRIHDFSQLTNLAQFDERYLHLEKLQPEFLPIHRGTPPALLH